jgi:monoamine oxidase
MPHREERAVAEHERECEVVVVGAGYSGLVAARHLLRAGVDTLVLDARHRVGGRSFTEVSEAGYTIDRGGQWIGPTQDHLAALAAELGVATFPTFTEGQGVELRDGNRHLYVGLIPTSDPEGAADGIACMLDLDLAAFDVPVDAPWDAADAAALDAQTLATYFDTHLTSASARAILEVAVKAIFGSGSGELSLLFTLFYLHAGGGLTNLARTTGGAQERRFSGGSQQLAEGMAAELGERVLLGAPVESVTYDADHVTVGARLVPPGSDHADLADPAAVHHRMRVRARRAILAMAPALCGRLDFSPPLPGNRDQLGQRMPMGAVTKIHAVYDEPFWRADGLNGQIVAPGSILESAFDNSPEDASHGAIVGFIAGDDCRRMETAGPAARQAPSVPGRARPSRSWSSTGPQSRLPAAAPLPSARRAR